MPDAQLCHRCHLPIFGPYVIGRITHDTEDDCRKALEVERARVLLDHQQHALDNRHATLPPKHVFGARRAVAQTMHAKHRNALILYDIADKAVAALEELAVGQYRTVASMQNRAMDMLQGKEL